MELGNLNSFHVVRTVKAIHWLIIVIRVKYFYVIFEYCKNKKVYQEKSFICLNY